MKNSSTLLFCKSLMGSFSKAFVFRDSIILRSLGSVLLTGSLMGAPLVHAEWSVDLSRRSKELRRVDLGQKTEAKPKNNRSQGFRFMEAAQEIVILNTEKGFIPGTVRLQQDRPYKIHIVNVNEKEKNVSFVMDSFSQHHATYFGQIKTFELVPKKDGIFNFVCPETSSEGRVVVIPAQGPSMRFPASEK